MVQKGSCLSMNFYIMKQIKDIHNNVLNNTIEATVYTLLFHQFSRDFHFQIIWQYILFRFHNTSSVLDILLLSHFSQTPPLLVHSHHPQTKSGFKNHPSKSKLHHFMQFLTSYKFLHLYMFRLLTS